MDLVAVVAVVPQDKLIKVQTVVVLVEEVAVVLDFLLEQVVLLKQVIKVMN